MKPSDVLVEGKIAGVDCVLLSRHGQKHTIMPTNVNYRANIWALKEQGCTHLIVTTACGTLKEEIHPGDILFPDQFIDRTSKRVLTFYDGEPGSPVGVCHIPMHTPFCPHTTKILKEIAKEQGIKFHETGTVVTIEGPRFSTRAESHLFRSWGAHIVNMTTVPEAILAKEVGLCYAAIALPTDYDCWHESAGNVNVDVVMECMKNNCHKATTLILEAVARIAKIDWKDILKAKADEVKQAVMLP